MATRPNHIRAQSTPAVMQHKRPSLFKRLARALRMSPSDALDFSAPPPALPAKPTRAEQKLHQRSATFAHTPDWLCTPITPLSAVPPRTPPPLSPSHSVSVETCSSPSPSHMSKHNKRSTLVRGAKRRMSIFSNKSQVNIPRSDSVLSFASADAFSRSDDDNHVFVRDPGHFATLDGFHRRARSNTAASNYSLPTQFGYQAPPSRSHRPKESESSIDTTDTLDSEVLMTCQMAESAYQAVRSRPPSLIKTRRSFADEKSSYGRDYNWI